MNGTEKTSLKGIRAAIIDLDGTMVHTAPDFQVAINRMRAELDLAPLNLETIKEFVGKGSENLMRRVLGTDFGAEDVERRFEQALQRVASALDNGAASEKLESWVSATQK